MEHLEWSPEQAVLILGAMKRVASEGGDSSLAETDRTLLDCAAEHVLHLSEDVESAPDTTPEQLAEAIPDARARVRAVTFLTLAVFGRTEVVAERANEVERYAAAVGVESDALANLMRLRDRQIFRLKFDFTRKMIAAGFLPGDTALAQVQSFVQLLRERRGDAAVAARFQSLEALPPETLGHAYFQFYRLRNYPLPGEKGCIPEDLITVHDSSHIIGGFNTDQAGEIGVAAFQAGYMQKHPAEVLLDGLTAFQLDIMLDPPLGVPSSKGMLDPHLLMVGLERGMQARRDLMDGWDYWNDFSRPVAELREEFGIGGAEDLWLTPPAPQSGDNRAASEPPAR